MSVVRERCEVGIIARGTEICTISIRLQVDKASNAKRKVLKSNDGVKLLGKRYCTLEQNVPNYSVNTKIRPKLDCMCIQLSLNTLYDVGTVNRLEDN